MLDPRRPLAHLAQRVLVRLDVELRDEAKAADDPERVVTEARRPGRAEDAALEVGAAAERVENLARLEPARDRVDREVAPLHVLLERDLAVRDDLEVVPAGAGRALDPRRRELDPGRLQRARRLVPRQQPHAHALVGDDEILDPPVRLERRPQLRVADAGDDEIELRRRPSEQLVAHRAAHQVGVEPERVHVVGNRVPHGRHCGLEQRHRLDLDQRAGGQLCDLDGRTGRRSVTDVCCVDLVHRGEVTEILEKDGRLHEPVEAAAGLLEDRAQVLHHLLGLGRDPVDGRLVSRPKAELAGDEDEPGGLHGLVVRRSLERRGRALGADDLLLGHVSPRGS